MAAKDKTTMTNAELYNLQALVNYLRSKGDDVPSIDELRRYAAGDFPGK